MARDHPFSFPHLGPLPGLPALEALNKQQKELLGSNIILPTSSPQGLLKAHSNLFPSHHGFPPLRPPSQVVFSHCLNLELPSSRAGELESCRVTKHKSNPNYFTANAKQSVQQPLRLWDPAELEFRGAVQAGKGRRGLSDIVKLIQAHLINRTTAYSLSIY